MTCDPRPGTHSAPAVSPPASPASLGAEGGPGLLATIMEDAVSGGSSDKENTEAVSSVQQHGGEYSRNRENRPALFEE